MRQDYLYLMHFKALRWAVKGAIYFSIMYLIVVLLAAYDLIRVDHDSIAYFYLGYSQSSLGVAVGFFWVVLDGFSLGFISGFIHQYFYGQ